jgi:oligoendopeptidase F
MKTILYSLVVQLIFCQSLSAQDLTSGLLERNQIPEKYKWNTSDVYPDDIAWDADYRLIDSLLSTYNIYTGRLKESPIVLLECLKLDEKIRKKLGFVRLYAKLNRDVEMQSNLAQEMWSRYNALQSRVDAASSFIIPELIELPEGTLENYLVKEEELREYGYLFQNLEEKRANTLSKEGEEFLAKLSPVLENPYYVFGSLVYDELPFPVIRDDNGEEMKLTRTNSWRARSSQDRNFRKTGYQGYYKSLGDYQATLTRNLGGFVKGKVLMAGARSYTDALEASLDRFSIPPQVYHNLINSVDENLQPAHRWMRMKKELLGLDTLYLYDTRVSIFPASETKISWEEAEALTYETLAILGDDYLGSIRSLYDNRWIDAYPGLGKETGGYSSGPGGPHPYVKMNWGDELFDFYTLVHELGHYVHAAKVMDSQPYIYWEYPPFLAEVASTTAENISQLYLIENAATGEEKLYHIEKYLDNVILNIYNSCMMAEFELTLYQTVEAGEPLSPQNLNKIYGMLLARYYGPEVHIEKSDAYAWMEYPHYYLDFYLYSYATSFSASIQIASEIRNGENDASKRFVNFLESGNSDYPVEILKKAGVDLTKPAPYEAVSKIFNELMDEMERILDSAKGPTRDI